MNDIYLTGVRGNWIFGLIYLLPTKERQKFKIWKPFSEERCLRGLQDDLQHDVELVANGQISWN
jgi:hypothetical protein